MTSSRLPGKVLMSLGNKMALQLLVERLRRSKYVDNVVVATTTNETDEPIVNLCEQIGVDYFRGSENDVLSRVLSAVKKAGGDILVEITGDCPLTDWRIVDRAIEEFYRQKVDYISNMIPEITYPVGFDTQVFLVKVLEEVATLTHDPIDRVHVSYYIYNHPERFKLGTWKAPAAACAPEMRLTLDERGDYELISEVVDNLLPVNPDFSVAEAISFLNNHRSLLDLNKNIHDKDPKQG